MKRSLSLFITISAAMFHGFSTASAHVSVSGDRTLGVIHAGDTKTNFLRTVSSSFGWADGTDDHWGDSHRTTAFQFTLASPQTIIITVQRNDLGTQTGASGLLLPAFSLYTTPQFLSSTHDTATETVNYLTNTFGTSAVGESFIDANSNLLWNVGESFVDANGNGVYDSAGLGGSGKKGAFRALDPWQIYVDSTGGPPMYFNQIIGHAADGTSANYGPVSGINGDGHADGVVTAVFHNLGAGDYYLFAGGANYLQQNQEAPIYGPSLNAYPTYGIGLTVASVPEPASATLLALSAAILSFLRPRGRRISQ